MSLQPFAARAPYRPRHVDRAVEAAGDVDVLLLDKTGTITLGNRQASELVPYPPGYELSPDEQSALADLAEMPCGDVHDPGMAADALRAIMRSLPHGVAVVTVDVEGRQVGLTVTSFVSLSLEPPLIGIAVNRQAALHELLRAAGAFALSLLAAGQEAVAQHFARGVPPIAMWHGIAVRPGTSAAPLLENALGWLECRMAGEVAAGTHTFFLGEVIRAQQGHGAPLVYAGQRYGWL